MANIEIAKALIERYRKDRAQYQGTIRIIDEGLKHYDYDPTLGGLFEITQAYRKSALDSISRLENLIELYEKDLKGNI